MPYIITFFDNPNDPNVREKKQQIRPTHLEYVGTQAHRILASGGFFPDDDDFPNGGLIILDVETRAEAIEYIENDPFYLGKVFEEYSIRRWKKFVWDGQRV